MDVNELRRQRKKLESDIMVAVSNLFDSFKTSTGFCPNKISINIMDCTTHVDNERQLFVSGCSVNIDL